MSYTGWILLTASLVGLSCGLVGVLLILRRMAMMADAISHTVLLGIVVAYLVTQQLSGVHMLIGATIAGLVTALLIQWFHQVGVQQEASIGIVFTTLFAIGVILIATKVGNAHLDVKHTLMGEITFIPWEKINVPLLGDIPEAVVILLFVLFVVLFFVVAFYKEWKLTSFDPIFAASIGIPVTLMHYVFMSLVSLTSVAAFDAVGAIMVIAMLITPAAAAYLWTDKLYMMLILSSLFGVLSAFMGYFGAVWLDTSISGAMAFATGIIFAISFFIAPRYGIIAKRRKIQVVQ
ncbi:MAG: metal ABC transporter permease [Candidatus Pristimantibacillus lignocellulolyticus]|uniref:Metal ABC transporter permease n=1 Tax=Candidatus Pristimantibacillus lignocellulolyticus TaxID=2994561 RepID=A0A9J6ZHJ8_9BACL|nr:MAG: metal ABC transporter permease [Candidatus Pristimantibacillus lignocellulolyticus]